MNYILNQLYAHRTSWIIITLLVLITYFLSNPIGRYEMFLDSNGQNRYLIDTKTGTTWRYVPEYFHWLEITKE